MRAGRGAEARVLACAVAHSPGLPSHLCHAHQSLCTPLCCTGDITRTGPMTVHEYEVAQGLTSKPVKGMLTGGWVMQGVLSNGWM